jgi:hypothetical protein
MLIWNMVGFGVSSVPNLTMFQIRFGISQIENYDLGCPKSKFRFGDIPNQIRNKVVFGLQHDHLTNHLFNQKKKVNSIF